jgi:hypothetical protein
LAKFINRDGSVDTYPGQVQYFFEHNIRISSQNLTHKLAYIRWYKAVGLSSIRFYFSINDDIGTCNVELWENSFFPISRDSIIPIHNVLCRFIPVKYKTSNRSNVRKYLATIPLSTSNHILEILQQEDAAPCGVENEEDCGSHMIQVNQQSYSTISELLNVAGHMIYEEFMD